MRWVCVLDLAFLAGFGLWLMSVRTGHCDAEQQLRYESCACCRRSGCWVRVGTLVAINYCIRSWTDAGLWFWTKVWNTLLMLACLGVYVLPD